MTSRSELWTKLGEQFERDVLPIVTDLKRRAPQLWSQVGYHSTAVFPVTGYVSLSKQGADGEEDLVLSWQISSADAFMTRTDISRGDGTVLAEMSGPALGEQGDHERAAMALRQAIDFFVAHVDLIRAEIC